VRGEPFEATQPVMHPMPAVRELETSPHMARPASRTSLRTARRAGSCAERQYLMSKLPAVMEVFSSRRCFNVEGALKLPAPAAGPDPLKLPAPAANCRYHIKLPAPLIAVTISRRR
jgi:hypothetical protein